MDVELYRTAARIYHRLIAVGRLKSTFWGWALIEVGRLKTTFWGWALIRGWALKNYFLGAGAHSRLGAYKLFLPSGWALIRGGRLFEKTLPPTFHLQPLQLD